MLFHLVSPLLSGTDCQQLCMTRQVGNSLWLKFGVQQNWEWLLPFKGKVLYSIFKIPGSEKTIAPALGGSWVPLWSSKNMAAQELQHPVLQLKSCSILCSHWCFFSKMCLVWSAHDLIAEREWRCHCQLTDPNGLSEGVTLKSHCTLHCSDLARDTLAAGEFPCCILIWKK